MSLTKIGNIHHAAYRCRDAEQTRWFYEDVLDLPYTIALVEEEISGTNIHRPYMHLFFELGDGNFLAFFDDPNTATPDWFEPKDSFDFHVAFEIDNIDDLVTWREKVKAAKVKCFGPIDHGFIHSIYFYDPNGIALEITAKTAEHDRITKDMAKIKDSQLEQWTQRTRKQKQELFGTEVLDERSVSKVYQY